MEVKGNLMIYVDLGCFDKEIVVIVIFSCAVKHTSNLFSIKTKSFDNDEALEGETYF